MEEIKLIKGIQNSKQLKIFLGISCLIILFVICIWSFRSYQLERIYYNDKWCEKCEYDESYCGFCSENVNISFELWLNGDDPYLLLIPIGIYILVLLFIKYGWDVMELIVTDKRVYGKTMFGKRVDLPLDSISSLSTIKLFKAVSIATSSGKISFSFMENYDDIYDVISELLIDRQDKKENKSIVENNDYIEELKKIKELLDDGIITKEEFDKKKKELLG